MVLRYPKGLDSIDWSVEPKESFAELKKQRALQLRNSYKYLILYYSGGSDSTTVLNTFLDNNIPLDEVIINCFVDIPDPHVDGLYAQKYLQDKGYKGKITLVNIDYDMLYRIHNKQMWFPKLGYHGIINSISRSKVNWFEEADLIPTVARPENSAHIYGGKTPTIKVKDNKYYLHLTANHFGKTSNAFDTEQFYTSGELPELHCKQAHMLAKYWKENFPMENVIIEGHYPSYRRIKAIIRDEFHEHLSALKSGSHLKAITTPGTENYLIVKFYKQKEPEFIDMYIDSTLKEFIGTEKYQNKLSSAIPVSLNKRYYLFDAAQT
jgi:hypothetical protein